MNALHALIITQLLLTYSCDFLIRFLAVLIILWGHGPVPCANLFTVLLRATSFPERQDQVYMFLGM